MPYIYIYIQFIVRTKRKNEDKLDVYNDAQYISKYFF